jgi:hypothetical protein
MAPKSKASGSSGSTGTVEEKIAQELAKVKIGRLGREEEEVEEGEEEEEEEAEEEDVALEPETFNEESEESKLEATITRIKDQLVEHDVKGKELRKERDDAIKKLAEVKKSKDQLTIVIVFPDLDKQVRLPLMATDTVSSVQKVAAKQMGIAVKEQKLATLKKKDGTAITGEKGFGAKRISKVLHDGEEITATKTET